MNENKTIGVSFSFCLPSNFYSYLKSITFKPKSFIQFFLFIFLYPNLSIAEQDRAEIASQLKLVRSRIVNIETELAPLKKEEEEVRTLIKETESQVKSLFEEQQKIKSTLESILKSQESLNLQMVAVREQISKKKTTFEQRVVHMYKTRRRLMPLSFLFASTGGADDFYNRSAYLRYLVRNDSNRLKEFTSLLETLKINKEEFARLSKEYEDQIKASEETARNFEMKQIELAKSIKVLDKKIVKLGKKLQSYNEQEEEYESLLKEITKSRSQTESPAGVISGIKPRSLAFPVNGKIVQHFGKQKHGEFKDIIFVKGVEVSAEEAAVVKVVKSGEVVFSSELPGFGNVLIVDHGLGVFSLYGRIIPQATLGQRVNTDEIIAKTGARDSDGRNFYFELRQDGKALNPERFFASQ